MRLEMGLDTRLALQQKLVLAPQILQSIEILQMTNTNLLEFVEEQLQENEALERDTPEDLPPLEPAASAKASAAAEQKATEEARGATEADAAPAATYEPEEWDELRSRRYDGEDGDKKYEALQNSPDRAGTSQDALAEQLGLMEAPERVTALARILVYNLDDDGQLPPHRLAGPLLDALDESGNLAKPLADVVAATLGVAAVKVPDAKRGVTPEQIADAVDARERILLEAQDVLSRLLKIRAMEGGAALSRREMLNRYPLVDVLDREASDWTLEEAEAALALVQRLEPKGVGGRTMEETVVLQLDPEGLTYKDLRDLVENHLDDLSKNRLPKIAKEMNCSVDDVKLLMEELQDLHRTGKLLLKPGARLAEEAARAVHPDVVVTEEDGEFKVDLVNSSFPTLTVNADFASMVNDKTLPTKVRDHARKNVESARWLIEAIQQRQATLTRVAQSIFTHQREFLIHGKTALRPLKMQTVADELSIHVSTVSRAIADKWVQTPQGVHTLKSFFIGGTENASGEVESRDNVKERVKEIIEKEDPQSPLSDDDVADKLKATGLDVARRTVTKYRKQLGIASSRQRKAV
jgi:RNA polymerase sigma-54 factor